MLEAPATTEDEVASEEHGKAPNAALLYGGVAPHPACAEREADHMVSGQGVAQYVHTIQVSPARLCNEL